MRGFILFSVIIVSMLCSAMQANAQPANAFSIEEELARPGVKLVVVVFFATWCEPCMRAVPEWKALHEKYAVQGLRFIVVNLDERPIAELPNWSPDRVISDQNGHIRDSLEIVNLPTSLLFSWDGFIAMKSNSVEPIREAIKRFYRDHQLKLIVEDVEVIGDRAAISSNPIWVKEYIIGKVNAYSKFDIVYRSNRVPSEPNGTLTNNEFGANALLGIVLFGDGQGNRTLTLKLVKLDDPQRLLGTVTREYSGEGLQENPESIRLAAAAAVKELLEIVVGSASENSMKRALEVPRDAQNSAEAVLNQAPEPSVVEGAKLLGKPVYIAPFRGSLTSIENDVLAQAAKDELLKVHRAKATTKDDLENLLEQEQYKDVLNCSDESCIREIVANYGIAISFFGKVVKLGNDRCVLSVNIFEQAEPMWSSSEEVSCDISALRRAVQEMVHKIQ